MYLTYNEYTEYGGTLEETAFNQFEFEARTVIDWWTFNRLQADEIYPEAVKRCMFKLIQLISDKNTVMTVNPKDADGTVKTGIMNESNDGVSTTYNTLSAKDTMDALQQEILKTIQMYLNGIRNSLGHKLLYRGLYPDE